jgi:hypothetical protein
LGATKSARQRLGRMRPSISCFSVCWRSPYQVSTGCSRDSSAYSWMSSSFTLLAGHRPITALAVSQRPSIRRLSMRWPSEYTRTASAPTTSSFRMPGKAPARSQVWKNGPQSM